MNFTYQDSNEWSQIGRLVYNIYNTWLGTNFMYIFFSMYLIYFVNRTLTL